MCETTRYGIELRSDQFAGSVLELTIDHGCYERYGWDSLPNGGVYDLLADLLRKQPDAELVFRS